MEMDEALVKDIEELIEKLEHGDASKNDVVSALESMKETVQEYLTEK